MPLGPRRTRSPIRRQHRSRVWATFDQAVTVGANQVKIVDLLNQLELAGVSKLGSTVVRVHLRMHIPTAVVGFTSFEYAIGVNPITTVGTLLPNPNADNDLDWMIFKRIWPTYSGATVDAFYQEVLDLKSRRKVDEMGQTLTLNMWSPVVSPGTIDVFARTLVLPS